MNRLIIILFFILVYGINAQKTYYISSSSGNDNNSGISQGSAFKTLSKINSLKLQPGDNILFKRGDTWAEGTGLKIYTSGTSSSRIIIGSYGSGNKPVLSLISELTGWRISNNWVKESNNIWKIKVKGYFQKPGINRLWLDGIQYKKAETKEKRWITKAYNDYPLQPEPRNSFGLDNEYRFYQENDEFLIYSNENPANSFKHMYTNISEVFQDVIFLQNSDYVTIKDLELKGGQRTLRVRGCDYVVIDNCDISYSTFHGIAIRDNDNSNFSENVEIKNCFIDGRWGSLYGGEYDYYSIPYTLSPSFLTVNIGIGLENGVLNAKVHDNVVKDFHFAAFRIHGTPERPSRYNEVYDNKCYFDSVVTSRLLHVVVYENPNGKLGFCSNNRVYRNYARNTRLTDEVGGDNNYIYYNVFDKTVDRNPRIYGGSGIGIAFTRGDPRGISKYNRIFNNTIYRAARNPLGGYPQKGNELFNNLIISSGTGANSIWIDTGNRGTQIKNNLIFFQNKKTSDIVIQFDGKGLTMDQFNTIDNKYDDEISGNILFRGSLPELVADPENDNFSIIKDGPADGRGIDISKYVPIGFKDINGKTVNLSAPAIGAVEPGISNIEIDFDSEEQSLPTGIKVYLEGSFNKTAMNTFLATSKLIPNQQPYNISPWNYPGSEKTSQLNENIVDWILVELRSSENNVFSTQAALLNMAGNVLSVDGHSNFKFSNIVEGDYYLVIYHLNHLSVMSAKKINVKNDGSVSYNFTETVDNIYGDKKVHTKLSNGYLAMVAGDSDASGIINNLDFGNIANQIPYMGYTASDLDMNGVVNVLDYSLINKNILRASQVPVKK